jgi:tellurite resistance protein TehA-like permease
MAGLTMIDSSQQTNLFQKLIHQFNMLWFIMALGFGGTSIAGFAFLNNTMPREASFKGMLYLGKINEYSANVSSLYGAFTSYLKIHMLVFGIMHLLTLLACTIFYFLWRQQYPEKYKTILRDTHSNSVLIAPVLAFGMAFNVFLVLGYVYIDWMRINVQMLLPYASFVYALLWIWTISMSVRLQAIALQKGFDVEKMHFGWLLIPFALAMTTVTGTGISYLAHGGLADIVFFLSITSFTMALFLLVVKLISLFKSHYASGLPEKIEFLPSFFVVVPIVTLLTISMLRYGYYFQHKFNAPFSQAFFTFFACLGFGLMTWYMILGLFMLRDYFKQHLFSLSYFDESQWGLICPMVAYAVLSTFVYKHGMPYTLTMIIAILFMVLDIIILVSMIIRQYLKIQGHYGRPQ